MGVKAVQDSSLAAVADAIRAKTGKSASMEFPDGFVSEIEGISGGLSWEDISKSCSALRLYGGIQGLLPEEITIDTTTLGYFGIPIDWSIDSGLRTLTIKSTKPLNFNGDNTAISTNGQVNISMLRNRGLKKLIFTNDIVLAGQLSSFFQYMYDLEEIYGEFDFTGIPSWTYENWFLGCSKLTRIRIKENTATEISTMSFGNLSGIDNDSLVSIANGLGDVDSAHTLQLHATPKARLSQIVGTVTLDSTETYHIFSETANGTVTLQDFITTTKGWTIS